MRKIILVLAILGAGLVGGVVLGAPAPKVFVCKYVGKPGVDEVLQTGGNPINVSSNSIKDYAGVGSYFNDAQGRSYVLAVDIGQPEPPVSECPKGDTPVNPPPPPVDPKDPPVSPPVVVDVNDPGLTPDEPTQMQQTEYQPIIGK